MVRGVDPIGVGRRPASLLTRLDVLLDAASNDFCHSQSGLFAVAFKLSHLQFRERDDDSWVS